MAGWGDRVGLARAHGLRSVAVWITAFLFSSMLFASLPSSGMSTAAPAVYMFAQAQQVSGDNILETIEDLQAFGSRDFHLDSSLDAADYIRNRFTAMGLETSRQDFEVGECPCTNIIATAHGQQGGGVVVVGAHYDSENSAVGDFSEAENTTAPGADDNASGVAVMLEVARIISGGTVLASTVEFVAFGAEERGFDDLGGAMGSMHYAISLGDAETDVVGGLVLDMVGYRSSLTSRLTIISNSGDDPFVQASAVALEDSGSEVDLEVLVNEDITYSDHRSFWLEGYSCALLTEELSGDLVPVNPYYHTSYDTVDTLSPSQLVGAAELVLEATYEVAGTAADRSNPVPLLIIGAVAVASGIVTIAIFTNRRRRT